MSAMVMKRQIREVVAVIGIVLAATASLVGCRVRDKVQETVAYIYGMQEYVYGFPLVMMDVTREVMTGTATTGEYKAPINQFARLRTPSAGGSPPVGAPAGACSGSATGSIRRTCTDSPH